MVLPFLGRSRTSPRFVSGCQRRREECEEPKKTFPLFGIFPVWKINSVNSFSLSFGEVSLNFVAYEKNADRKFIQGD